MTDRGFRGSCGTAGNPAVPPGGNCGNGYVHLLSAQYEVRDAQYLLGLLADEGLIAPKQIGAVGGSYGGGMSMQLGALKNRIIDAAGNAQPWKSPGGKDMEIAATAPEFGWSNLAYALVPNGSTLDYAALNPYRGTAGNTARVGLAKDSWLESLYFGGISGGANGYYCGFAGTACADARFNLHAVRAATGAASPAAPDATSPQPAVDGNTVLQNAVDELNNFHSAYSIDDSVAPAPQILSNGWNDDLFPVDEAVRYYNKVRQNHPDTPINLWAFDWGHPTRGPSTGVNPDNATSLFGAEGLWFDFYIRGIGSAPQDAKGGATTIASGCSDETSSATLTSSPLVHAPSWAALQKGELSVSDAASQNITATNTSSATFQPFTASTAVNVCTTAANTDTTGAAKYTVPAQAADYTILGSPTVSVDLTTGGGNDGLLARLYDVNTGANNVRLIARAAVRPRSATPGASTVVFQLHPQQWKVVAGHTLKLELMAEDDPYIRPQAGQAAMAVMNLQLRVPTANAPTGNIKVPAAKPLPTGYVLARDFVTPTPTAGVTPTVTVGVTPTVEPTVTVTATPTYTVPKGKKTPGLTGKVNPRRDKKKPFKFKVSGSLKRPSGVAKSACSGKVKITVKKGKKTIGRKTASVKKSCKYAATVKLNKKAGKKGKAKFTIAYQGNSKLKKKTITRSARYG
jgi:hypothetical protein